MKVKIWAVAALLVLLAIILIQNTQEVVFRIFFWKVSMSQVILVPLAVLVGFLFGFFLAKVGGKKSG
ncbi:MAG: LapA family protein [Acidobacteriota bacterium]